MKVFVQVILLSILFGFCSVMAIADDQTPAEEDVCAELQLPGVTPGLYGLCNAYCEAQDCDEYGPLEDQPRSCQKLWENFVNKATGPDDPPEPPCLEENEPEPEVPTCACWPTDLEEPLGIPDALQADNLPLGDGGVSMCFLEPENNFYAAFFDGSFVVSFILLESVCDYVFDDAPAVTVFDLEPEEVDDCRAGILYLHQEYANEFIEPCILDGE